MDVVKCPRAQDVYERYVKPLSPSERLGLMALTALGLSENELAGETAKRDIMELRGLGAPTWEGIDAQSYVDELRSEWDGRPS